MLWFEELVLGVKGKDKVSRLSACGPSPGSMHPDP